MTMNWRIENKIAAARRRQLKRKLVKWFGIGSHTAAKVDHLRSVPYV